MADVFTKEKRSQIMALVKSKGSIPEILVKKMVHTLGFRFRNKEYNLPGKPDIVLPRYKTAIFVHGCFWHQHKQCRGNRIPKSRVDYWKPKLERNVERDSKAHRDMKSIGWKVLVVWECSLKDPDRTLHRLRAFLSKVRS